MYYILFLLGSFFSLINGKKNILLFLFTFMLSLVAFFRYGVGSDYFNYQYLYERLRGNPLEEIQYGLDHQEIGFRIIGSLFKGLGFSYEVYLMFFAFVNLLFVYKLCKKYSQNPVLSMLIYFSFYYFVWTFSGIRQGVVIAVGVYYLLHFISKKLSWKFFAIVGILTTLHTSAVILVLFYLLAKLSISKSKLILLLSLSFVVSFLPLGLIMGKLTFLPFYSKVLPYLTDEYSFFSNLDFQSIGRLFFVTIVFIYYDAYVKKGTLAKQILNIYIFSICLYFVLKFSELTAARLSIYGKYLDVIILVNIYYLYKQKINKLIYSVLLFLLMNIYFYKELNALVNSSMIIIDERTVIVPYTNIWIKEDIPLEELPFQLNAR